METKIGVNPRRIRRIIYEPEYVISVILDHYNLPEEALRSDSMFRKDKIFRAVCFLALEKLCDMRPAQIGSRFFIAAGKVSEFMIRYREMELPELEKIIQLVTTPGYFEHEKKAV